MSRFPRLRLSLCLLAASTLSLFGCAGGSSSSGGGTSPQVSVTVTGASTARLGTTTQLTATVTGTTNTAVIWQVNGVTGGSTTTGTISTAGLYTAPTTLPASPYTVTITASSQASTTATGSLTENLENPVPVPTSGTATEVGTTQSYTLDIIGTGFIPSSVIQVGGVTETTTYVSATELKTTITVSAGTNSVSVSVSNPAPGAAVSAAFNASITNTITVTLAGASSVRLGATAQYTASVTGTTNTAVTWQVNGVTGGNAVAGTITATGLYTPPATLLPSPYTFTISAVSQVSATSSGSLTASLQNPLPVANSGTATEVGTTLSYLLDIIGTGFTAGSVLQVNGSAVATSYISPTELQATVTVAVGATTVSVLVTNPNPGAANSAMLAPTLPTTISLTAAARILDQTSFGPTAAGIQQVAQIGINNYLVQQFATPPTVIAQVSNPEPTACVNNSWTCAESEVWSSALSAPDQLRQRVAFALAEMFVVSSPSIQGYALPTYQNNLVNDAFGNFYTIMNDVTLSPAMGGYLNMLNSAAPAAGQIANENYPRELMQLFTLGTTTLNQDGSQVLDSNGNSIQPYTELQVEAFARAYTGWTYATATGGSPTKFPNGTAIYTYPMAPVAAYHDTTSKILLNGTTLPAGQTAQQDLSGALTNIFNHPNVAPFVCKQLIQHLVTSTPSPAYVSRVSAVFNNDGTGTRGNMKAVLTAILTDTEARAGDTNSSYDGGHLREPILFMANMYRALGFSISSTNTYPAYPYYNMGNNTSALGENFYSANSVFNFFPPDYVIPGSTLNAPEFGIENTASVILEETLVNKVVFNGVTGNTVDLSSTGTLGSMAANPTNFVNYLSMLFMHSQMPTAMQTQIINTLTAITNNNAQRARVGIFLVLTSPQYKIIH